MCRYVLVKPAMSMLFSILHKAETKPRPSGNIKGVLWVQVGFNYLLSHKKYAFNVITDMEGIH